MTCRRMTLLLPTLLPTVLVGCSTSRDLIDDGQVGGKAYTAESVIAQADMSERPKAEPTARIFSDLAYPMLASGRSQQAEKLFRRALEVDDRFEPARVGMLRCRIDRAEYADAVKLAETYLRDTPDSAALLNERGVALARMERYDQAAAAFGDALAQAPGNPLYHRNLAGVHAADGRYEAAFESMAAAGSDADARVWLANVLERHGDSDAAIDQASRALAASPRNPEARALMQRLGGGDVRTGDDVRTVDYRR